jgi:1-acyl-sn-glycerol-3-phosphate acyltransferase
MEKRASTPILYRMIRRIFKSALALFFHSIEIRHGENIPEHGPVVLAANHPSSTMDAIVMSAVTPRMVHHIGHSGLFRHKLKAWLLRNCGVIPVYRRRGRADDAERNLDSFQACYEVLEAGGAISIFPEGISDVPQHIQKLKTGAARIALEAERRNQNGLGVLILPIGLHFFSRSRFRSKVLVNVGRAVDLEKYLELNLEDNAEAVKKLTSELQSRLERLTVNIRFSELEHLVADIENLYMEELLAGAPKDRGASKETIAKFVISQRIAECVEYYHRHSPERVANIREKIDLYKRKLKRLHLKDSMLRERITVGQLLKTEMATVIKGLLGFPLAVYGILNNFIPYRITESIARKFIVERTKILIALFLGGGMTFALFYALQVFLMWHFRDIVWAGIYLISLPLSGFFTLAYTRALRREQRRISFSFFLFTKRHLVGKMRYARTKLITELDAVKEEYLNLMKTSP